MGGGRGGGGPFSNRFTTLTETNGNHFCFNAFQEMTNMYKSNKGDDATSFFSSAHTADPKNSDDECNGFPVFFPAYRYDLAAKVTRIIYLFVQAHS